MSILKVILHRWNKTTKSHDTVHPETEVAQVTDWNQGIVNTLASTGLSNLVNVLSSDSLLALLIKKVFDATGVKYSLDQNGYVCFGSWFGGLIIQWGSYTEPGGWNSHNFPIVFTHNCFAVMTALQTPTDNYTDGPGTSTPCVKSITTSNFICSVNGGSGWRTQYIAIGN